MTTNTTNLIQPLPVARDSDGYWFHIGVPNLDEGEEEQYKAWLESQRLVTEYKMLKNEAGIHPAHANYFGNEDPNISAWEPAAPAGDGWFTISIHDTEDGPIWVWARRVLEISIADPQDDDAAVFDDHAVDLFTKAMKDKLAIKRQQGFGGWHDISQTSGERLAELLLAAVAKGDPVDVANFAMMLFCRHENHAALKSSCAKFIGGHQSAVPPQTAPVDAISQDDALKAETGFEIDSTTTAPADPVLSDEEILTAWYEARTADDPNRPHVENVINVVRALVAKVKP